MRLDEAAYEVLKRAFRRRREQDLREQRREFQKEAPEYQRARRTKWIIASLLGLVLFIVLLPSLIFGSHPYRGVSDPWWYVNLDLKGPDGRPIDSLVWLVMADGTKFGRPHLFHRNEQGTYHDGGIGPGFACVTCEYEVRATGFQPYRFMAGRYCKVLDSGTCFGLDLTATLVPAETSAPSDREHPSPPPPLRVRRGPNQTHEDRGALTVEEREAALSRVWDRIWKRISSHGISGISKEERAFAAIWRLEAEVNNGGFAWYMSNDSGDEAAVARQALDTVSAQSSLLVFDDFLAQLPGKAPASDRNARQAQLDRLARQFGDWKFERMLGDLDWYFYTNEEDLREHLYVFAKANGWI
jgi:hypothetical protein